MNYFYSYIILQHWRSFWRAEIVSFAADAAVAFINSLNCSEVKSSFLVLLMVAFISIGATWSILGSLFASTSLLAFSFRPVSLQSSPLRPLELSSSPFFNPMVSLSLFSSLRKYFRCYLFLPAFVFFNLTVCIEEEIDLLWFELGFPNNVSVTLEHW